MRLKEIKTIDVYTRWWHDAVYGNPYYARKIVVNLGLENEKTFVVPMSLGTVSAVEDDKLQKLLGLPDSVTFTDSKMYRKRKCFRWCKVRTISYTYHKAKRVYNENALNNPARFRNI